MTALVIVDRELSPALELDVVGLPAPQGSKRHVGHGIMVETSRHVKAWRDSVATQVLDALPEGWQPLDGPLYLGAEFYLPRPKVRKKESHHVVAPDLDKLIRSTCDALTAAGVWRDDARVAEVHAVKLYTTEKRAHTGASLYVAQLPP